jgi:hypothetical protein
MNEAQHRRVEHGPGSRQHGPAPVLPSGLELTGDEGRSGQPFQHLDASDRLFRFRGRLLYTGRTEDAPGAPQAIAPVGYQESLVDRVLRRSMNDRQIPPRHRVGGELFLEMTLSGDPSIINYLVRLSSIKMSRICPW